MLIENIELSTVRISLFEEPLPGNKLKQHIQYSHDEFGVWDETHHWPLEGLGYQLHHPDHHWSREVIQWLKHQEPGLIAEYLAKVPTKTLCFAIRKLILSPLQGYQDMQGYAHLLQASLSGSSKSVKVYPIGAESLVETKEAFVYIGEPDSFVNRYGELEPFLTLLNQLVVKLDETGRVKRLPTKIEALTRTHYQATFQEWVRDWCLNEPDHLSEFFFFGLINGVPLDALIEAYVVRYRTRL